MIDMGGDNGCYYKMNEEGTGWTMQENSGCRDFFKTFLENLNTMKTCKGNALEDGCIPKYPDYNGLYCDGFHVNGLNTNRFVYVLADGQIVIPYQNSTPGVFTNALFLVDINGMKGPNKSGYDVFSFAIYQRYDSNDVWLNDGGCFPAAAGGRTTKDMMMHALGGKE